MIPQYEPPLQGLARLGYVIPDSWTPLRCNQETTRRFLDRLYPIPDPIETVGQFERFSHSDLAAMPLEEIYREARRVQLRLDYDDRPAAWLLGRLQALREAITLRRKAPAQAQPSSHAMRKSGLLRTVHVEELPSWH